MATPKWHLSAQGIVLAFVQSRPTPVEDFLQLVEAKRRSRFSGAAGNLQFLDGHRSVCISHALERGSYESKKIMGCPSTPIQEQPNLHDDYSYIDLMQHVKNFVQELNHIHTSGDYSDIGVYTD